MTSNRGRKLLHQWQSHWSLFMRLFCVFYSDELRQLRTEREELEKEAERRKAEQTKERDKERQQHKYASPVTCHWFDWAMRRLIQNAICASLYLYLIELFKVCKPVFSTRHHKYMVKRTVTDWCWIQIWNRNFMGKTTHCSNTDHSWCLLQCWGLCMKTAVIPKWLMQYSQTP